MTFVTAKPPSVISPIGNRSCMNVSNTATLHYAVGKNTHDELLVHITQYSGGGKITNEWFAIFDLTQQFALANGSQVPASKLEPFDNAGIRTENIGNNDMPAFLKAVLRDLIMGASKNSEFAQMKSA